MPTGYGGVLQRESEYRELEQYTDFEQGSQYCILLTSGTILYNMTFWNCTFRYKNTIVHKTSVASFIPMEEVAEIISPLLRKAAIPMRA